MASVTCSISKDVLEDVKKCRLDDPSANMLAYIAKIDLKEKIVVKDDQFKNITFEELIEELPEDSPRYIVLSYRHTHKDGHVSYPLVFIYYMPTTANTTQRMLYASTQQMFGKEAHLSDPYLLINKEDLNEKWLEGHLNKFSS